MNHIGIDVTTKSKGRLITRLRGLVSTVSAVDGGPYHQDLSLSQVWLDTNKGQADIERWLDRLHPSSGIDYIGTFIREPFT